MKINDVLDIRAIEQFVERIGVDKVFGASRREDDVTIIPVAQVEFGFGFGGGFGSDADANGAAENPENGLEAEGGGGGGGGGGRSTPRGYIRVSPEGVEYTPIQDELRIPLGGLFVGAWSIFWIMLTIRVVAKAIVSSREKILLAKETAT